MDSNAIAAYAASQFIGCLLIVLVVGIAIGGLVVWLIR